MRSEQHDHLVEWLRGSESLIPFGEISVKLIRHDGKTVRVEKSILEREQAQG